MKKFFYLLFCLLSLSISSNAKFYNVLDYGAKGDNTTICSPMINKAIDEAVKTGGGTIYFPAGKYLSYTIRLKDHITLYLDNGAKLIAAKPTKEQGYEKVLPPTEYSKYQDFGHNNWRNSLIWGENITDIAIVGQGEINGAGLGDVDGLDRWKHGVGRQAIGLKLCRNVTVKDVTISNGGHFAILATGVDNLTLDNIRVDTNRDGFDIDCCKNVRVSNCTVNSPFDDAICLKSSYALGYPRITENVTITNCQVSAYDRGTLLDTTYKRTGRRRWISGRIKFGTESNGGFRNITISNCVFDYSRGLALETVDGGVLEDVSVSNITMRGVADVPLFIRLGLRMKNPNPEPKSICKRISVSNIVAYDVDPSRGIMLMGSENHPLHDITLSNFKVYYRKAQPVPHDPTNSRGTIFEYVGTKSDMYKEIPELDMAFPEDVRSYPEPHQWNEMPSYALYARHIDGLRLSNMQFFYEDEREGRPAIIFDDVKNARCTEIEAMVPEGSPYMYIKKSEDINLHSCKNIKDTYVKSTKKGIEVMPIN